MYALSPAQLTLSERNAGPSVHIAAHADYTYTHDTRSEGIVYTCTYIYMYIVYTCTYIYMYIVYTCTYMYMKNHIILYYKHYK